MPKTYPELECQRSAQQCAANCDLGVNLEDFHEELECQRFAGHMQALSAFPPTVPPSADDHKTLRDSVLRDLGHGDNLLNR